MGPAGPLGPKPADKSELEWQLRNFTKFLWVSGGLWAEMDIHQIDELCWLHDALPVSAQGVCGRAANSTDCSQNLDSFNVEWTFPNGTRAMHTVRYIAEDAERVRHLCAWQQEGRAVLRQHPRGSRGDLQGPDTTSKGNIEWRAPKEKHTVWQNQWNDFLEAIRTNKPFNQAKRAAHSNLAVIMGRAAMHMGRSVTWDEALASNFQWFPGIDQLTHESEPPIRSDEKGALPRARARPMDGALITKVLAR